MAGTIDEDFIVGQLRSFYKFANNLANEEKRFEYIFNQINSTEECMESSATKNTLIKRMVTWALKEFNATKFRSDVRMLTFWKLLGKYSTEMKTEGVLSEVDRLGFFKTTPEFYVLWAEYWASQNSRKKFERAMQLCKENCALDEYQSDELFGPIIRKYYKDTTMNFDGDRTRALFNFLNEKPQALAIPNLSTETTAPMNAVVKNLQPKEEFSVFCDRTAIVEEPAPAKCSSVKVSAAAVIKSPAQKQRRISVNPELFAECDETVAGAHGRFGTEHGLATSTPRRSVMPGQIPDISLFSPMVSDNHEAAPKEQRRSIYSLPSTLKQPQFATRISFGQSGNMEPTTRHQVHTSSAYDRKSIAAKTVELSKAMPQLKINSTIDEVSEGRENTNETTRVEELLTQIAPGSLNPWDENERKNAIASVEPITELHRFESEECQRIEPAKHITLGGERFSVEKLIGDGGFARVYRAFSIDESKVFAIKYESPACPWEVYICSELKMRLPSKFQESVMQVRDAYVFPRTSAIVYEYHPLGTLLDLVNVYKADRNNVEGTLVAYLAIQMATILQHVHEDAKIIHADVKPDNFVITRPIPDDVMPIDKLISLPVIKLIDWGRAIDMNYYEGQQFIGRAGTHCFDCPEMIAEKPWNYQTDFFGFIASIYVLATNEYLEIVNNSDGRVIPKTTFKRRLVLREMWVSIFDEFLNIPNCSNLPSWESTISMIKTGLKRVVMEGPYDWKRAQDRYNTALKGRNG